MNTLTHEKAGQGATHSTRPAKKPTTQGTESKTLSHFDRIATTANDCARGLIYSWVTHGRTIENDLPPADMPSPLLQELARILYQPTWNKPGVYTDYYPLMPSRKDLQDELVTCAQLCSDAPAPGACKPYLVIIQKYHQERKLRDEITALFRRVEIGDDVDADFSKLVQKERDDRTQSVLEMLQDRAFDPSNPPPKPIPIISLASRCIATPGNILSLQAGVKAGKTAAIGGIIAASFQGTTQGDHDTLGFICADNEEGHAVLHFDTEQSRFDHYQGIQRALARVGMAEPPEWFSSFTLADLSLADRIRAMDSAIETAAIHHGGIRLVILDGVADFISDPNDGPASFEFVDKLHSIAIRHACVIATVLHENPGSETAKTRGHLGSQLTRKAETNLRLAKDLSSGITTVWTDYARSGDIPKHQGYAFKWSDQHGRHMSCKSVSEIKQDEKREAMREEVEDAFGTDTAKSYSALVEGIMSLTKAESGEPRFKWRSTAEKRIPIYQQEGFIKKTETGKYVIL
jgi:hypothetical protein